jgi:hypothetical protein
MAFTPPPAAPDAPPPTPDRSVRATFHILMNAFLVWFTPLRAWAASFTTWAGTFQTELLAAIAGINAAISGGALAIDYTFDSTTADSDPGPGKLRLSNGTQNLSGVLRLDLFDNNGSDQTAALELLDDSTSSMKGILTIRKAGDGTKFLIFAVASMASPSGYRNVTGSVVGYSSASPFTNGDSLTMSFSRTGDQGQQGIQGNPGTLAGNAGAGINGLRGPDIASGASPNIWLSTQGNSMGVTGSTPITGYPNAPQAGAVRTLFPVAGVPFTAGASHVIQGVASGASYIAAAGDIVRVEALTVSTFETVISKADGTAVAGGQSFGTPGTAVVANAVAANNLFIASCTLPGTTRGFAITYNGSNYPQAVLRDSVGTAIAVQQIEAVAAAIQPPCLVGLTSTTALLAWTDSTNAFKAVVLTDATSSVGVGAVSTMTGSGIPCIVPFSATKVGLMYGTSAGAIRYNVATIAGNVITPGTDRSLVTSITQPYNLRAAAMSATQGVLISSGNSDNILLGMPLTENAGTITPGASATNTYLGVTTVGAAGGDVIFHSGSQFLLVFGRGGQSPGAASVITLSGTGSSARLTQGRETVLSTNGSNARRLARVSATTYIESSATSGSLSQVITALYVSGNEVKVGPSVPINTAPGGGLEVCVAGTNALAFYSDLTNSGYPTSRPIPLGSVA